MVLKTSDHEIEDSEDLKKLFRDELIMPREFCEFDSSLRKVAHSASLPATESSDLLICTLILPHTILACFQNELFDIFTESYFDSDRFNTSRVKDEHQVIADQLKNPCICPLLIGRSAKLEKPIGTLLLDEVIANGSSILPEAPTYWDSSDVQSN
jgi:hypothetical protein